MCSLPFPAVGQRVHLAQQKIPHPKIAHQHDVNVFVELCLDPPDSSKTPSPSCTPHLGGFGAFFAIHLEIPEGEECRRS